MAAADSFVGEGLSPSPYAEALARAEELRRLVALYGRVINRKNEQLEGLHAKWRDRGIEVLDAKLEANKLRRRVEMLERDNAWLREMATNLSRKP